MTSPYASVGPRLVELGYSAIPIAPGSKYPGQWLRGADYRPMTAWSQYCARLPTAEEAALWATWPGAGVGVATGPASRVVGLDFDTRPEFWSAIEGEIPTSPLIKRGQKGYTAFYCYAGETTKQFILPGDSVPTIEILAAGRQSVIPPTPHPDTGRCYQWDGDDFMTIAATSLPMLPPNIAAVIDDILGIDRAAAVRVDRAAGDGFVPSPEMAEEMLAHINPEVSAARWIAIGSSLKSAYPDDVAFDLWNLWSSRDKREWRRGIPQYQPSRMYRRWQGIDPAKTGVTIGTFIQAAKDGGFRDWHFDDDRQLDGVSAELAPPKPETIIVELPAEPRTTIPKDIVAAAPGLVGDIAEWITATAIKPQPVLSLGAALAFVGAIKGKRVRTPTNLRTNLYVLGLGGTGSGKNHPIDVLQFLHTFIYRGAFGILGDRPASEPGLYATVNDRNGRCLILWDEIGHAISAMSKRQAATHYSAILSAFTEFFSAAGRASTGTRLAGGGRDPIVQPCLCVYGTTVPDRFFESLTEDSVVDGFLARWLVFECDDSWPDENDDAALVKPKQSIVDRLLAIEAAKPVAQPGGVDVDTPPVVPYGPEGGRLMRSVRREYRELGRRAEASRDPAAPLWVRAAEHVAKLALVVTDGDETGEREVRWAHRLVQTQCQNMVNLIEARLYQNEQERVTKRVLRHIRAAGRGGITRSELTNLTFDLKKRERDEVLDTLVESGQVTAETGNVGTKGPGRRPQIFRIANRCRE